METTTLKEPTLNFRRDGEAAQAILGWWRDLETNRGGRADLRRCLSPSQVLMEPAYHALHMQVMPWNKSPSLRLATIAGILSHVRTDAPTASLPTQLAKRPDGKGAAITGLRFRRILQIPDRDHDHLYPAMVRVVRLLGGTCNVLDLAAAVWWWNERTKRDWAFAYYTQAPNEE